MTPKEKKVYQSLIQKVNPRRFLNMSRGFAALIQFFTGHDYGLRYRVYSLSITSDGFLQGRDNEHGSIFIGTAKELENNLIRFVHAAGLTPEEIKLFNKLFQEKFEGQDWRWTEGYETGPSR